MKKFFQKLSVIIVALISVLIPTSIAFGALTQYGLPGIYNSTAFTLPSGTGSAVSVDSAGRVLISPDSSISSLSIATLTGTTANFTTLNASNTNAGILTISQYVTSPLYVGNGSSTTTISGNSTSTFPYGATFATVSGKVGIGTSTPQTYLTISGSGTNDFLNFYNDATKKSYVDYNGTFNGGIISGSYEFTADAGAVYGLYLPTQTAAAGTEESITTMIGNTWLSKAYCENTGTASTTQNCKMFNFVPTVQAPDPSVTTTLVSASTTLPLTYPTIMIQGNGTATTSTALPFLTTSTAFNGMEIEVIGMSDTNLVTIQDKATLANSGLHMNSTTIVIGLGDVVKFKFDDVNKWWNLTSYINNL